jgi:hypothetical protein
VIYSEDIHLLQRAYIRGNVDMPLGVLHLPKLAVAAGHDALHSIFAFHSLVPQEVGWLDADVFWLVHVQ